jgi:anti-anti-sigma factor
MASSYPVLAHFGHWYVAGPVFLGPVILLVVAIKVAEWRERRRAGEQQPEVDTTWQADHAVIAISGRLDRSVAAELEAELALVAARELRLAVLDLRATTSVDEAAIGRLIELEDDSRRAGVDWTVLGARPAVRVSLEMSGLTDLVALTDTPQAVRSPD